MKFLFRIYFILIFILPLNTGKTCNLSSLSVTGITQSGGNWTIDFQLCIGGGRNGLGIFGANFATFDIAFGFYNNGAPLNFVSFSPDPIFSPSTGCSMPAFDVGPQGFLNNSDATLYYYYDGAAPGCGNGFECIISQALCQPIHSNCQNFSITFDALPDSMRVFGVEGAGDFFNGCYPNSDMGANFNVLLGVDWGTFTVELNENNNVELNWQTITETNNSHFEIEKFISTEHHWHHIGHVNGSGTSSQINSYQFTDDDLIPGNTYYRIVQYDFDGKNSRTPMVRVEIPFSEPVIYPNPVTDVLKIEGLESEEHLVSIYDLTGKLVANFTSLDLYLAEINLDLIPIGIYLIKIEIGSKQFIEKLIKCE